MAELHKKVKAVPFQYRKNVRTLAFKIGIPKSTVHDALKKGLLKHTRNSIRPILTDKNKADRVYYCLSYWRGKTRRDRYVSKLWSTQVLGAKTIACCVCHVCCMCCPKLVVNRNWWCGAGQMLASLLDGSSCVP
jgi:hypothetical protein